jgi:hypothetical protein
MAMIWKSTKTNHNTLTGTALSSWTRQQKLAVIAGFAILGVLLGISACSKQSPRSALVAAAPAATTATNALPVSAPAIVQEDATPVTAKKTNKKRPANVTYTDANSGVSFLYPRKFVLASGEKNRPELDNELVPMNFSQAGGETVATVALPKTLYPGTDFTAGFFGVRVNRSLSEEQCSHFAFVDTRNPDGEPVDAEKVKIGSEDMEMTSEFLGSATRQSETQYYHDYEDGACYEYVLGLGTAGFGTQEGIKPVDRDAVFSKLEKIMATVKIAPSAQQQAVNQPASGIAAGKE